MGRWGGDGQSSPLPVRTSVWLIGRQPEWLGRPAISQRTCTGRLRRRLLAATWLVANGERPRAGADRPCQQATRGPPTAVVLAEDEVQGNLLPWVRVT